MQYILVQTYRIEQATQSVVRNHITFFLYKTRDYAHLWDMHDTKDQNNRTEMQINQKHQGPEKSARPFTNKSSKHPLPFKKDGHTNQICNRLQSRSQTESTSIEGVSIDACNCKQASFGASIKGPYSKETKLKKNL